MIYTDEYQLEKFTKKFRLNHENSSGIYKDKHAEIEALLSSSPPLKTPSITTHAPQPQDDIEIEMPFDRRSPSPVPQQHIQTRADLLNNANPAGNQQLDPKLPNNSYSKIGKARKKEILTFAKQPLIQPPRRLSNDNNGYKDSNPSILSKMLVSKSSSSNSIINGGSVESLDLRIYLPDCSPIDIKVSDTLTVEKVIAKVLATHLGLESDCKLHNHAPQCYELRLHEGDGEPDEDFPALDVSRAIALFGDGDAVQEYCLCQISSVEVPPPPTITANANMSACRRLTTSGEVRVKVNLPDSRHAIISCLGDSKVRDLVKKIMNKHMKLKGNVLLEAVLMEGYEFHVTEDDAKRLGFTLDTSVGMDAGVKELEVEELFFRPRHYEDGSQVKLASNVATRGDDEKGKGKGGGPDLDSFMFDEITAGRYCEYKIIKKNKFGRRQERIFGIDATKIYNSKRGAYSGALSKVYRGERLLQTVKSICRVEKEKSFFGGDMDEDDFCSFRIEWIDSTGGDGTEKLLKLEYTAETAEACAEIVAKVLYLTGTHAHTSDQPH